MTKKDIVKNVADKLGLTQVETKEVVQATIESIIESILEDGGIELRNFGVFKIKQRAQRKARNPRTGEEVIVPPRKVVIFKPGRHLEKKVLKAKVR